MAIKLKRILFGHKAIVSLPRNGIGTKTHSYCEKPNNQAKDYTQNPKEY
jgi:hypothetical protein